MSGAKKDDANNATDEDVPVVSAVAGAGDRGPSETYLAMIRRLFFRPWMNRVALAVVAALILTALFADFIASEKPVYADFEGETYILPNLTDPPELRIFNNQLLLESLGPNDSVVLPLIPWGYNTHDLDNVLSEPTETHWLGTDERGRDVLSRVIHGTRVSLLVGFLTALFLTAIGVLLGSVAGYLGGIADSALNRVVEILNSIPSLLIIVVLVNITAPQRWSSVFAMAAIIGVIRWTTIARLIRGEILKVKTLEYVDAARVLGAGTGRILIRHVIPNSISPVLVAATFATGNAILIEGSLSFLGFGIPDDMASWGGIMQGVRFNNDAWWLGVFPGIAVFLTITAFNLAGEGLRDAIDPRLKQ